MENMTFENVKSFGIYFYTPRIFPMVQLNSNIYVYIGVHLFDFGIFGIDRLALCPNPFKYNSCVCAHDIIIHYKLSTKKNMFKNILSPNYIMQVYNIRTLL